jgi:hypothetical protein
MRRIARLSIVTVVLGCLPVAQADSRGGAAGRGGTGGVVFHLRPAAPSLRGGFMRRPVFANNRRSDRVAIGPLRQRHFVHVSQMVLPTWWGGVWAGYPDGWWPGNAYQLAPEQQTPPSQPQVIVIGADNKGDVAAANTVPDYSYVPGCHAIANGYHCDLADATH